MVKGFIFFRTGKIPFVIENYRMDLFTDDSLLEIFCKEYNFKENYILQGLRPVQFIDTHHKLLRADLPDYLTGFPILMVGGSFPLRLGYDFLSALWTAQNIVVFWSFDYGKFLAIGAAGLCF